MSYLKKNSETRLSDLIAAYLAGNSVETWMWFLDAFQVAELGVHVVGVPSGVVGKHVSTDDQPLSVGITKLSDGLLVILSYADPVAYVRRFGQPFNGGMIGSELLHTALANPECDGVLVNSALADVSVLIDRATAEALVRNGQLPTNMP